MIPEDYVLVFEDNFDGGSFDLDKWNYRATGKRRCGFNSPGQVSVENGNLIIRQQYRDGEFGPGWYSGMINIKKRFLRGYFEIRCICSDHNRPDGFWSAFWLQAPNPYDAEISRGGPGGAEIDVIEGFRDAATGEPGVESNIHVKGMKNPPPDSGCTEHLQVVRKNIPDCYTAFHTYACEWTDKVYRFFVDGELTCETSWGDGVSAVDEEVIVSLELPGECGHRHDYTTEFIVDYVRVYQKPGDLREQF